MAKSIKRNWIQRLYIRGLSIQHRLPLLICILLLCTIIAFSWTSYIGVKRAAEEMSKDRLKTLTTQFSEMLGQSAQVIVNGTRDVANRDALKNYLITNGSIPDTGARRLMERIQTDSFWVQTLLLDARQKPVLQTGFNNVRIGFDPSVVVTELGLKTDTCIVGKLYVSGDSILYPVVSTVMNDQQVIGYLLRWRLQKSTARALTMFSQILGDNARLYLGNSDGQLWTDFNEKTIGPPIEPNNHGTFFKYTSVTSDEVIAMSQPLPFTKWMMVIEFSQDRIVEAGTRFFHWIIIIGSILIAIGIFIAWLISRNITVPLAKLTNAASVIADGNYSVSVPNTRTDELGKLAVAFNTMAEQVKLEQSSLEKKVRERTTMFEEANKELESFSYSVSHDLRAPLRIINGYTEIITSDYQATLDDEGNRMLAIIAANAKKMGHLIDDLLNLSRMGRKELTVSPVNMTSLVQSVVTEQEQLTNHHAKIILADLGTIECDSSLMRQVWTNLIANAIKYSGRKEKPVIEITAKEKNGHMEYCIQDNGVGFDMQYADKLFGVFQRLHKATEYEGTGVGLALVQRIVSRHRGKVWAKAAVDDGATFCFSIPFPEPAPVVKKKKTLYDHV